MPNKTRVTFVFDDDEHFHRFLEQNNIETYTYNWKKGEFLIDLSSDVKESIKAVVEKKEQTPAQPPVNEFI